MKQSSIILLACALLATVNAAPLALHKRDTSFAACSSGSPTPLTVSISPDPPAAGSPISVTIGGTSAAAITAATALVQAVDNTGTALGTAFTSDFCTASGIKCPLANGAQFSGVVNNVALPATLPDAYNLVVELLDSSNNVLGCSTGAVSGGAADGTTPSPDGTSPDATPSPSPDSTTPDDGTGTSPDATPSSSPDSTTPDDGTGTSPDATPSPSPDSTTPDDGTSPGGTNPDDGTSPSPDGTNPDDGTSPSPDGGSN